MTDTWIPTGKAAKLLGYSPGHFREKFQGLIPSRRFPGGYRKWLRAAVEKLAAEVDLPQAG
jgi:hypothetical protein